MTQVVEGPAELSRRSWWGVLKRTVKEFRDDKLTDWAAALTYYAVLSIFPALLAVVSLLGLFGQSATQPLVDNLSAMAPGPARQIIDTRSRLAESQGAAGIATVVGVAVALWSASGYVAAFMRAANVMYEMPEGRPDLEDPAAAAGDHHRAGDPDGGRRGRRRVHRRAGRPGGRLLGIGQTALTVLGHRQVADAGRRRDDRAGAAVLGGAQRRAPRLPVDHPRQRAGGHGLDRRVRRVRLLRGQLRHPTARPTPHWPASSSS